LYREESIGENIIRGDAMERKAKKRQPGANSQSKIKALVSAAKTRFHAGIKKVRKFLVSLKGGFPPLKDTIVLIILTVIAFASGFFVGKESIQSVLPGNFVSIRELDMDIAVTEDVKSKDIPASQTAETVERKPATVSAVPATDKGTIRESPPPVTEKMIMPVQGRIISGFGWRKHPVYLDWRYHTGIDFGVPEGSPVKAALSGKVVEVDSTRELGLYIIIEHSGNIRTKYAHLKSNSVKCGDSVRQGQVIGSTGRSGVTSGSYLHFEVVSMGEIVDPQGLL